MPISPPIDYSQSKFKKLDPNEVDDSGGAVLPNGQKIAITRFRGNGAEPDSYVVLAWDYGGADEKIVVSTRGDVDLVFDVTNPEIQFVGNGTKKLSVVLINDKITQSPVIGGSFNALILEG